MLAFIMGTSNGVFSPEPVNKSLSQTSIGNSNGPAYLKETCRSEDPAALVWCPSPFGSISRGETYSIIS